MKRESVYPNLIAEHEEIIHFIQEKNKTQAAEMVSRHIDNQVDAVMAVIRNKQN